MALGGERTSNQQKAVEGYSSLTPRARLIYCLWAADYGMRNAGDLTTAADLLPTFLADGHAAAQDLRLPQAIAAFSLTSVELEQQYFDMFDKIAAEIRAGL
jgi:hypothetical protein